MSGPSSQQADPPENMTPDEALKRINVDFLFPSLLEKLHSLLEACAVVGADYLATDGFRSEGQQSKLYFQGRTDAGKKVTNARPWQSAHNYGLAVDFCRVLGHGEHDRVISWEPQDYETLGEQAEHLGLIWGGRFHDPDRPHVEWPGYVSGEQLIRLKPVFRAAQKMQPGYTDGLLAVWSHVFSNADTNPDIKVPFTPTAKV